ncbi:TolC family protein [Desulfoscipio geothermicus]|uniref:Outer membrane protein TolC n=1 Tax=Desulfoscipio geothermicus DSM 3669 TaxID=1121426 RepID=A0A1I6DUW5_9FIRM|nr:TolC family protein [Desulfoscipio geothermicus]SFR09142.1 Outer membrane protein TolC [Desulfoscipio geothermicus DSM 3669]
MKKKLVLLLTMLFMLVCLSAGYASENDSEDAAENVVTLEQVKELALENSRNLTQYEINKEKAKYQFYQADDQYDEAEHENNNLLSGYNNLGQEYSTLQELLNEGDTSVISRMNDIKEEMSSIWENIDKNAESIDSLLDKKRDAEANYNDAKIDEENYKKQLEYIVEEQYTTILNQENNLLTLEKELEVKQSLLNLERARLALGNSNQLKVDQLAVDVSNIDKQIIELMSSIKKTKGNLNDMIGRDYDDELILAPFEIPETGEVPDYDILLSRATGEYDKIDELKRDIEQREDDLDYVEDDNYQEELLELEIEEKELQLKDERYKLKDAINNLMAEVKLKQEEYQLSLINYNNAQQNYEWDKKRFELGQISKMDLLQSELDCFNMKDKNISAGYGFYLAYRSLKLAEAGILLN